MMRVPDVPAGQVRLGRAVQWLDDDSERTLVVVAAPAGCGKTTVLAQHARALTANRKRPDDHSPIVSWLTLDRAVDDPRRFLTALVGGLQAASVPGAREAHALAGRGAPTDDVVHTLINGAIGSPRQVVSFIDGFEHACGQAVHDIVALLVDQAPPQWRFVIASRTTPPLTRATWRAQMRSAEMTATELRLGPDETLAILRRACGSAVTAATARALGERMRGWAAGIALAGRYARHAPHPDAALRAFDAGAAPVVEYVTATVLETLTARHRRFVVDTSPLVRLTGALCASVTRDPAAPQLLQDLAATQTFLMPVDGRDGWYEYHPAFREAFRTLGARTAPKHEADVYRRAHTWCREQRMPCDAMDYALRASRGDTAATIVLLETHGDTLTDECPAPQITCWMRGVPDAVLVERPALRLLAARAALASGDPEAAGHVTALHDQLPDSGALPGLLSACIDLQLLRWRLDGALTLARGLETSAGGRASADPPSPPGHARDVIAAARALWIAGEDALAGDAMARLPTVDTTPARAIEAYGLRALIAYGWGDERVARSNADAAARLLERASIVVRARSAPYAALAALWSDASEDERWVRPTTPLDMQAPGDIVCVLALIEAERAWRAGETDAAWASLDRAWTVADRLGRPAGLAQLVARQRHRFTAGHADPITLSPSEQAVLALLPTPLTNRQIADRLHLSHNTVKTHLRTLYRKLGVSSRSAAVERAAGAALLDGRPDTAIDE